MSLLPPLPPIPAPLQPLASAVGRAAERAVAEGRRTADTAAGEAERAGGVIAGEVERHRDAAEGILTEIATGVHASAKAIEKEVKRGVGRVLSSIMDGLNAIVAKIKSLFDSIEGEHTIATEVVLTPENAHVGVKHTFERDTDPSKYRIGVGYEHNGRERFFAAGSDGTKATNDGIDVKYNADGGGTSVSARETFAGEFGGPPFQRVIEVRAH